MAERAYRSAGEYSQLGGGGGRPYGYERRRPREYDHDDTRDRRPMKRRRQEGPYFARQAPSQIAISPEEEERKRLRGKIVRLGDRPAGPANPPTTLREELATLAEQVVTVMPTHQETILSTLFACVSNLPHKTGVYAALAGLLNQRQPHVGQEIAQQTCTRLQDALDKCEYEKAKFLVRFAGELAVAKVVTESSFLELLDTLTTPLTEEAGGVEGVTPAVYRTDALASVVLGALVWSSPALVAGYADTALPPLLRRVGDYVASDSRRRVVGPLLSSLAAVDGAAADTLAGGWEAVSELRGAGWRLPEGYYMLRADAAGPAGEPHSLAGVRVAGYTPTSEYPVPRVGGLAVATGEAGLGAAERFFLEEAVADVLHCFSDGHKECAKLLLTAVYPVATGRGPATPQDLERYDHVLCRTVLGQLLRLPSPPCKPVYYAVVLADLAKLSSSFQAMLQRYWSLLFGLVDRMDRECFDRLVTAFAYYQSNFEYGPWPWGEWRSGSAGQRQYLGEVLDHSVRLSYWERLHKAVPEAAAVPLPPKPDPVLKLDPNASPPPPPGLADVAAVLLQKLRAKEPHDAVTAFLEGDGLLAAMTPEAKQDVLLYAVLLTGSKSFSHLLNALERYLLAVKRYVLPSSPQRQLAAIRTAAEFWKNSHQHLIIVLDKLMTYRIVDNTAIVSWVFSPEVVDAEWPAGYVFEILHNTLAKTIARTDHIRSEHGEAAEALRRAMAGGTTGDEAERERLTREALDVALREQRELFRLVFQRFVTVLSTMTARAAEASDNHDLAWCVQCALGRLREVARRYHRVLRTQYKTLESELFTAGVSPKIASAFKQAAECFGALHG